DPNCVFARSFNVQVRPELETTTVCGPDDGPSDETNATSSSLAPVVENAGATTDPVPSIDTTASTVNTDGAGAPVEITRATALPLATCVPPAGVCVITNPAATVVLDAVVIAPTLNPAPVIAAVAAACVWPTTLGVATSGSPLETTSETALPVATCVPAAGSWLITVPAGTVVLGALVIAPTVSPAVVITVIAAGWVRPTTLGAGTCGRPLETTSDTALLIASCVPAAGVWLITDPAGTVVLDAVVTVPSVSPAPVIAVVAAACVWPTTFGVATCGRPL